jgi:hypothetical protein
MFINYVVATRGRVAKLERMIESIPAPFVDSAGDNVEVRLHVVSDGCEDTKRWHDELIDDCCLILESFLFLEGQGHSGAVKARNELLRCIKEHGEPGHTIYGTDDIVFRKGSVQAAWEVLVENGCSDMVVGFHQEGNKYHPAGVALVGEQFLDRYPNHQLFYPKYFHFSAQEIYRYAEPMGKFYLCKQATIYHFHPMHHKEEMDQCHVDARVRKAEDMQIIKHREEAGLVWPEDA